MSRSNDNLRFIDSCIDGWDCPDAEHCNDEKPETCPLYDNEFENLEPTMPLDKRIKGA